MKELDPLDDLPVLRPEDVLDELPLLTEVIAAPAPVSAPEDGVTQVMRAALPEDSALSSDLPAVEAELAPSTPSPAVSTVDTDLPEGVSVAPTLTVDRAAWPSTVAEDASPLEAKSVAGGADIPTSPLVGAVVSSDAPEGGDGWVLSATGESEPVEALPSPQLSMLDEPAFQRLLEVLESRLVQRLGSPEAGYELSEDNYERLLDRLEDHLENLLHQKMELYVARLRPAIVAQVMEEMRHDALQMVLGADDGGT